MKRKISKVKKTKKVKGLFRRNFKGAIGSNMLYLVILTGAVVVSFMFAGSKLPSQNPSGLNKATVTILPGEPARGNPNIQMQTFGGVTGIPTPTNTPTPEPAGPGGGGVGGDPTIPTCGSTANTPTAPVTGYTIKKCEDFTSGLGAFGGYEGGGGSTVVGGGRKTSQCTATGGMLVLTQLADGSTCGGSMGTFNQRFGYWEVKMRTYTMDGGAGSAPHPVLILWPDTGQWADGEMDFFESDIGDDGMGVFLHCVGNPSNNCVHETHTMDISQWHVYGFEWTAAGFKGFVDGQEIYSVGPSGASANVGMHQTIQLDNLTGRTPVKPGKMEIDWVHMYSK